MKSIIKYISFIIFIFAIFLVFIPWFSLIPLSALDFNYVHESAFVEKLYPYAWNLNRGGGLGGFYAPLLWNYLVQVFPINLLGSLFGLDWTISQKLIFFYPFLA